jgi:signal transduction histidine kinase/PAS domain-containing protein
MSRSDPVRTAAAELTPLTDAEMILEAIVSNGQAKIFLVNIAAGGRFVHVPLIGNETSVYADAASHEQTPEELFGPADGFRVTAHYRDCVAAASPIVYEDRLSAEGDDRWWQTNLTPIKNRAGKVVQILGIAIDITERKRVETRLSVAERQFQTIVANIPGVVYRRVLQPDGRLSYPYISKGIKPLLGHAAAAVQANPALMLETIHPQDRKLFDRAIARSAKNLSPFELEMRSLTATGEERWIRSIAQTTRLDDGTVVWDGLILDITDRKRAEAEVREREHRLRDFAAAASDWLWEMDADLRFTEISDRFFAIYNIRRTRILGKKWDQIADTSDDPEKWQAHLQTLAEHRPFDDLVIHRWRNGFPASTVKVNGRPVFDENGVFHGYRGTGTDLTAQRLAEKEAAAASSRLLNAIECLSEAIAIFDADDRLVLCNARYREINHSIADILVAGTSFEALMRKGVERGIFPAAVGREKAWLRQRMADHAAANGSFERQTEDGEWLQVLEQRTPDGGIMILGTDITEVKRRAMALATLTGAGQDGAGFFADAARSLAVGLGYRYAGIGQLIDEGRRIKPLALCDGERLLPTEPFDIAGTPCEHIVARGEFLAAEGEVAACCPSLLAQLGYGAVAFIGDIVTNVAGRPIGVVFGLDDKPDRHPLKRRDMAALIAARVSLELQRREAEEQLRQAKEAAEIASRAKSEFLANMSHELRTPLNAVIGFAQMIGEEILGPVGRIEYKEYARDIHASSLHLLQIINDILDVSKIEAGMVTLHDSEVDFAAIVNACCRLVRVKAAASEIALTVDIPDDLPVIRADERMLKQVLLNLLSNALKFTPKGGAVTVQARADGSGGLSFMVKDTGIGIDSKDFDKIFRPFGQVDSSLTRKFEGTGLGLPLTKGLVELHGGTIMLESEVGRGTCVTISLPKRRI